MHAQGSNNCVESPDRDGLDLFESLSGCRSVEALYTATARIVHQLGFEHFIYGVRVNLSPGQPYQFVLSGYPEAWFQRYTEAGYENIDPVVHHCIIERRVTPLIWSNQVFRDKPAKKLWGEANEFGLAGGVSFPVQGINGERAILSLATSRSPRHANRDIADTLGQGQLLALYVHDAVRNIELIKH